MGDLDAAMALIDTGIDLTKWRSLQLLRNSELMKAFQTDHRDCGKVEINPIANAKIVDPIASLRFGVSASKDKCRPLDCSNAHPGFQNFRVLPSRG
jgi:hypothetical protein